MRGEPKNLNSKADYLYAKEHFNKEYWLPKFKDLITSSFDWFNEGKLDSKKAGIEDNNHKVVEDTMSDTPIYYQYAYKLNDTSKLIQLGFTFKEVVDAIHEVEPDFTFAGI